MEQDTQHDERARGLTAHVGGRLTDDEWAARGSALITGKPVGEEADETTKEGSAGLPPRGVGRTEDDERYAGVKTLALGGYASGLID